MTTLGDDATGGHSVPGSIGSHHAAPGPLNILGAIGNTPLVELTHIAPHPGVRLLAELETTNPSGSSKDRIAIAMIDAAERRRLILSGDTIIEPTSGNTGIALAMICRVRGYRLVVVMPDSATAERVSMLPTFGAEIIPTDGARGSIGAIEVTQRLAAQKGLFMPFQYGNPANPAAHCAGTAQESCAIAPRSMSLWRASGRAAR